MMEIRKFTPSVDKRILVLIAGLMWCGVGAMLIRLATVWLTAYSGQRTALYYGAGFLAAMPVHHFGFLRIADKNLKRLLPLTKKKCLFSFMTWRSYIIVPVMVSMGIMLRHSSLPKQYLAVLYTAIGLALFLSGFRYIRFFFKLLFQKEPAAAEN